MRRSGSKVRYVKNPKTTFFRKLHPHEDDRAIADPHMQEYKKQKQNIRSRKPKK